MMEPVGVVAVDGDTINFTCVAEGVPRPVITWEPIPPGFTNSSAPTNANTITSTLTGTATENNTMIQCTANNIFNTDTSEIVLIILAGM